jgi:hypothetical protein
LVRERAVVRPDIPPPRMRMSRGADMVGRFSSLCMMVW